jgi:FkbM family methyltransferase
MIEHEFQGHRFRFTETPNAKELIKEIFSDNYKVLEKKLTFSAGDVILDIGANEGMFSIMMAVLHPTVRVISLEPIKSTYDTLCANIRLNSALNAESHNFGVGKPGLISLSFITNKDGQSGGSTNYCTFNPETHERIDGQIVPFDSLFPRFSLDRVRLLKMDIEGGEYDALYPSKYLSRVDYMTAEFHMNRKLEFLGRRMDGLATWVANQTKLIHVDLIHMAE